MLPFEKFKLQPYVDSQILLLQSLQNFTTSQKHLLAWPAHAFSTASRLFTTSHKHQSFDNLLAVLNACAGDACGPLFEGADFIDAGSGCGKQVVAAALLPFKFRKCAGVELLESLDGVAQGLIGKLKEAAEAEGGLGEG